MGEGEQKYSEDVQVEKAFEVKIYEL